jgi:hypothetical protein
MNAIADELGKCRGPKKAKQYAVLLTRTRTLFEQIQREKKNSTDT